MKDFYTIPVTESYRLDKKSELDTMSRLFGAKPTFKYWESELNTIWNRAYKKGTNNGSGANARKRVCKIFVDEIKKKFHHEICASIVIDKDWNLGLAHTAALIYNTDRGRIYKTTKHTGMVISSHACKRFLERVSGLDEIEETARCFDIKDAYSVLSTAFLIETVLLANNNDLFAKMCDNYCYIKTPIGILVTEFVEDIIFAKSWLGSDMTTCDGEWIPFTFCIHRPMSTVLFQIKKGEPIGSCEED